MKVIYSGMGNGKKLFFLMDTKCTIDFQSYSKLEFKEQFRGLLEQLSLFYCLFVEIESEFK